MDYVDLFLIHWPAPKLNKYVETYRALEELYSAGKIRAIGVSNFHIPHIQRILDECTVKPTVNQIECHPFLTQVEIREFCKKHDIFVESWSPIMRGGESLNHEVFTNLAEKYGKNTAQIVLRWHVQSGMITIPKSVTPSRIEDNFNIFDFQLDTADMDTISSLNSNERLGPNPENFE